MQRTGSLAKRSLPLHKEEMFKTAYAPSFGCYVGIDHSHQDDRGEWIFTCHFTDPSDNRTFESFLFRTEELENFVL